MQAGYMRAAWHDIRTSPNWFGKLLLLALIVPIPFFGDIVLFGYLLGWGRDAAWGIHSVLPAKIFRNDDGMLYARGVFSLVITALYRIAAIAFCVFLCVSVHYAPMLIRQYATSLPLVFSYGAMCITWLVCWAVSTLFIWVGLFRMSIYGRLAPGFQLGKIVAMIRYDFVGIMRIMGMMFVLVGLWFIVTALVLFVVFIASALLVAILAGNAFFQTPLDAFDKGVIACAGFALLALIVVLVFADSVVMVFIDMVVVRSLGYWVFQFDVNQWGGQDDPLPFQRDTCRVKRPKS